MTDNNQHSGSNFDEFLVEDGILEECTASAIKRVLMMEMQDAMKAEHITKTVLAKRLHTSRSQVDRVLDPKEVGTSIESLARTAMAIGKRLEVRLS